LAAAVIHTGVVTSDGAATFELGTDGPTAILVGIDGSTTSLRAGAYAAGLARRQGARIIAVYVGSLSAMSGAEPGADAALFAAQSETFDRTATDLRRMSEEMARERGIAMTFVAARGDSFTELLRIAAETRADAIVVGASTKAGHRLVGSLAVRLVRAGKWPVTVVP
jgi:nucleotide-binding universal stress UspA family protein